MKRKDISDFEGTKLEKILDDAIDKADFYDDLYIEPNGEIRIVSDNLKELFKSQHKNLNGWTKVCFGYDREGF